MELKTGETYRGELNEAEDNWNCQLKNVTATARVWTAWQLLSASIICIILFNALCDMSHLSHKAALKMSYVLKWRFPKAFLYGIA